MATALSQSLGGLIPLVYFSRPNGSLFRLGKASLDKRALAKACINGSSELMSNISMSLVGMLYNLQLLKYAGEDGARCLWGPDVREHGLLSYHRIFHWSGSSGGLPFRGRKAVWSFTAC